MRVWLEPGKQPDRQATDYRMHLGEVQPVVMTRLFVTELMNKGLPCYPAVKPSQPVPLISTIVGLDYMPNYIIIVKLYHSLILSRGAPGIS